MIARRLIKRGQRLITDKPLIVLPQQVVGDTAEIVANELAKLTKEQKATYFGLANSNLHDDPGVSIFQTNAVSVGPGKGGVCPKMARLNHACLGGVNSMYSFQENTGNIVVHALRDIQEGEELLVAYTNALQLRAARQWYLKTMYNFECACVACSRPKLESEESDARLAKLPGLEERLKAWADGNISGNEALQTGLEIWEIRRQEGYLSGRGQLLADMAHVAAAHSNEQATMQFSKLAAKWFEIEIGNDSFRFKEMEVVLIHGAKFHAVWGSRDKEDIEGPELFLDA